MRGVPAWCVLGGLVAGGCIDVPAHRPCPADDLDCDGWTTTAANPGAVDCDDGNPAINPGALADRDPDTDEDCIPPLAGPVLVGVTADEARSVSGALDISFGSPSRMPLTLRIAGGDDVLSREDGCEVRDEEGMGISLYPAIATHARTALASDGFTVERDGPAMATSLVAWTVAVPATGASRCDAATVLAANIRFTVLPGRRLIRHDIINVGTEATRCYGCPIAGGGAPVFTSYLALVRTFDRMRVDSMPEVDVPDLAGVSFPGTTHRACVRESGGDRRIAMAWRGVGAAVRVRPTTLGNTALVYDWVPQTGTQVVAAGSHEAFTTMIVDATAGADCDPAGPADLLLETLAEVAMPPGLQGLTYEPARGTYEATVTTNRISFRALSDIEHGLTVRILGLGDRGVTVWYEPSEGGGFTRLVRDWQYLVQYDPDATVVFLPSLALGAQIVLAGPGGEPPP